MRDGCVDKGPKAQYDAKTATEWAIWHGRLNDQHIYFLEVYNNSLKNNQLLSWEAMSQVPDGLFSTPENYADEPDFVTTGERQRSWDELLDDINRLKTAPINEADVVRSWLRQQSKAA